MDKKPKKEQINSAIAAEFRAWKAVKGYTRSQIRGMLCDLGLKVDIPRIGNLLNNKAYFLGYELIALEKLGVNTIVARKELAIQPKDKKRTQH